MGTVLDDAILHTPAFAPGVLEVQVTKVDTRTEQLAQGGVQVVQVQA